MTPDIQKDLYGKISSIIKKAESQIRKSVNSTMVLTYWSIGKIIVEDELQGNHRAEYGKEILKDPYILEFLQLQKRPELTENFWY